MSFKEKLAAVKTRSILFDPENIKQTCIANLNTHVSESDREKHEILCDAITGTNVISPEILPYYLTENLQVIYNDNSIIEELYKKINYNSNVRFAHSISLTVKINIVDNIIKSEIIDDVYIIKHHGRNTQKVSRLIYDKYFKNELENELETHGNCSIPIYYKIITNMSNTINNKKTSDITGHMNMLFIETNNDPDNITVFRCEHFEPNGIEDDLRFTYYFFENIIKIWFGGDAQYIPPHILCPPSYQNINSLQNNLYDTKWSGSCSTISLLYGLFRMFFSNTLSSSQTYDYINSMIRKYGPTYISSVITAFIHYLDFANSNGRIVIVYNGRTRAISEKTSNIIIKTITDRQKQELTSSNNGIGAHIDIPNIDSPESEYMSESEEIHTPIQLKQICIANLKPTVSESDKIKHEILCDAISGKKIIKSGILESYFKKHAHEIFSRNLFVEAMIKKLGQNTKCGFLHTLIIIVDNFGSKIHIQRHIGKAENVLQDFNPFIYITDEIYPNIACNTFAIPIVINYADEHIGHQNMLIIEKLYNEDGEPLIENGKPVIRSEHFEPHGVSVKYMPAYETVKSIVESLFGITHTIHHYTPTVLCPIHLQNRLQRTTKRKWAGTCTTFSLLYAIFRIFFINMSSDQVYNYINSMLVKYGPNNYIRNVVVAIVNYLDYEIVKTIKNTKTTETTENILVNGRMLPKSVNIKVLKYYNKLISDYNNSCKRITRSRSITSHGPKTLPVTCKFIEPVTELAQLSNQVIQEIELTEDDNNLVLEELTEDELTEDSDLEEEHLSNNFDLSKGSNIRQTRSRSRSRERNSEKQKSISIRDRSRERYREEQKLKRGGKFKVTLKKRLLKNV